MEISFGLYFFQSNFFVILSGLFLVIFMFSIKTLDNKTIQYFINILIITLILIFTDGLDSYLESLPTHHILGSFTSAVGYTLRPMTAYFMSGVITRRRVMKKIYFLIPAIVNCLLVFISIPYPIVFSYDANNVFIRGPLGYLPFVVSGFYVLSMIYFTITVLSNNFRESIVALVMFPCIVGAVVCESVFHMKFILTSVLILAVMFYYLNINVELYKKDDLTELLNRRCFYLKLDDIKKESFIIVSMDLNDLKIYNDQHGHAEGDKALCTIVEVMEKAFYKFGILYRIGGDEFAAICENKTPEEVQVIVDRMQEMLSKTPYAVAYGFEQYKPGDNIDEVIKKADKKMYKNKLKMKLDTFEIS